MDLGVHAIPVKCVAIVRLQVPDGRHVGVADRVVRWNFEHVDLHGIEGVDPAPPPVGARRHPVVLLFQLEESLAGSGDDDIAIEGLIERPKIDVVTHLFEQDVGRESVIVGTLRQKANVGLRVELVRRSGWDDLGAGLAWLANRRHVADRAVHRHARKPDCLLGEANRYFAADPPVALPFAGLEDHAE